MRNRVAIVHRTHKDALRAVLELGIDAMPLGWGSNVRGYSFDKIIILCDWRRWPLDREEWLKHDLLNRLTPNGSLIDLT